MILNTSFVLVGMVGWLAAGSAVARAAHGLTFAGESPYVAAVDVVQHDKVAPPAFADGLREAVLGAAVAP